MASPVIADPFHRMKYMERHGSGLRKIVRETEKPPGYTAAYNPKIFSTATDFRVILKNVNYQLSQKNLVNDQVSEQDKSPDIPHTVLNLCIHLIAHGSEGAQITHAHSIMGTANDKSYDATHDNLEDDTHQGSRFGTQYHDVLIYTSRKNIRWNDAASCNRYASYIEKDIIFLDNHI